MSLSEADIKKAVHRYCQRAFSVDQSADPPFAFSKEHTQKMMLLLGRADRRHRIMSAVRYVVACLAVMIVVFAAACIASPSVWAAVRSWYVINIGPDQIVYEFEHGENDHAFLVVRPNALPDGFELTNIDEGNGYSIQYYENSKTEEYVKFSYHWLTVRERAQIEKLIDRYGTSHLSKGYDVVLYKEDGLNKLTWYDKYNCISYWVESNLPEDELIAAFDNMEMHPPVYMPTWLPEGYELVDNRYETAVDLVYYNHESEDIIMITIEDYGWTEEVPVLGEGEYREITIKGNKGIVHWGGGLYEGTVLVFVDKNTNLLFFIQTGRIDADLVIRIAEHLERMK